MGRCASGNSPSTTCKSVRHTPQAKTLTRISPLFGVRSASSVHSRGVLCLFSTMANMKRILNPCAAADPLPLSMLPLDGNIHSLNKCPMLHQGTSWLFGPGLALFVAASLVLAVTPGPGVIYLVTRTLSQGRRVGLASTAGVALGNFGNAAFAGVGLAMVFAVSARSFMIVKLAGAAYLVFLGVKALRPASIAERDRRQGPRPHAKALRDGFVVALLNPKT